MTDLFGLKLFKRSKCLTSKQAVLLGTALFPIKDWINGLGVAAVEQIAAREADSLGHRGIH